MSECNLVTKIFARGCKKHYGHGEFATITWTLIAFTVFIALLIPYATEQQEMDMREQDAIERFDCLALAEYIADAPNSDKHVVQSYAEHRFKWLCAEEKALEFKGD